MNNNELFEHHNKLLLNLDKDGTVHNLIDLFDTTQTKDIDIIFNTNDHLKAIGTKEEYHHYLYTIFPQSTVKGIVYHETDEEFDAFSLKFVGKKTNNKHKAIFFTPQQNKVPFYGKKCIKALINITGKIDEIRIKDKISEDFKLEQEYLEEFYKLSMDEIEDFLLSEYNNTTKSLEDYLKNSGVTGIQYPENSVIRVFDTEQIHILGSQRDILGFSNYIKNINI